MVSNCMAVFSDGQKDSMMGFEVSARDGAAEEMLPSVVLLVEDDPDIRGLTRTFLEHEGYSVFSSGDAERGMQIFRSVPRIDLLVTDLYLPGRSGWELAQELKSVRRDLAVLMISGVELEEDQELKLRSEGWSFLAKPFRLPELLAAVHRILAPVEARRWREARRGVSVEGLLGERSK
jgi:two-component system, chemotaxis family, chemotaxis protein CheY